MIRNFARILGLVVMLGILYSGPAVPCVCPDHTPAMPCCPDGDSRADQAGYLKTDSGFHSACEPVSADLLAAATPDLPALGAFEPLRPRSLHPLPTTRISASPQRYVARPIYLVTERRRE